MNQNEKICGSCGAKLSDEDSFCSECGLEFFCEPENDTVFSENNSVNQSSTTKNVGKKQKRKFLVLGVLLTIVLILLCYVLYKSPPSKNDTKEGMKVAVIEGHGRRNALFNLDLKEFTQLLNNTCNVSFDDTTDNSEVFSYSSWECINTENGLQTYSYPVKNDNCALIAYIDEETKDIDSISLATKKESADTFVLLTRLSIAVISNMSMEEVTNTDYSYNKATNGENNSTERVDFAMRTSENSENQIQTYINNIQLTCGSTNVDSDKSYFFLFSPMTKEKICNDIEAGIKVEFLKGKDLNKECKNKNTTIVEPDAQTSNGLNFSSYIGNWQDTDNDLYQNGGSLLEIKSIDNNNITFSLTRVFSGGNMLTFVDDINATITNNEADFTFTDSRGNAGEGTLKFKDNAVTAIFTTTQKGEDSTYSADVNAVLHRSEATSQTNNQNSLSDDFIFPDSNTRYLSRDEVMAIDPSMLVFARNEIFARYGRMFDDPSIQDYFNSKSWYSGTTPGEQFDTTVMNNLNSYEKANVEVIKEVEVLQKDFAGQRNWNNSLQ